MPDAILMILLLGGAFVYVLILWLESKHDNKETYYDAVKKCQSCVHYEVCEKFGTIKKDCKDYYQNRRQK